MKPFLLLAILLLVLSGGRVRAQAASTAAAAGDRRTEEYCEVQVGSRPFSWKVVISVDFGQVQEGLLVDTYRDTPPGTS